MCTCHSADKQEKSEANNDGYISDTSTLQLEEPSHEQLNLANSSSHSSQINNEYLNTGVRTGMVVKDTKCNGEGGRVLGKYWSKMLHADALAPTARGNNISEEMIQNLPIPKRKHAPISYKSIVSPSKQQWDHKNSELLFGDKMVANSSSADFSSSPGSIVAPVMIKELHDKDGNHQGTARAYMGLPSIINNGSVSVAELNRMLAISEQERKMQPIPNQQLSSGSFDYDEYVPGKYIILCKSVNERQLRTYCM